MYGSHWLLITLLGVTGALAGSAELDALDRQLEAVHLAPGAVAPNPEALMAAVQALQALEAAVGKLPADQRDAGLVRLADGYQILARDLLAFPCPDPLDPELCAVFLGLLAERAQPMVDRAATVLEGIQASTALSRREHQRRDALAADLGELERTIESAVGAMARSEPAMVRAEPGSPQSPAPGWSPPAGAAAPDARFAVIRGIAALRHASGETVVPTDPSYSAGKDQLYVVELLGRNGGLAELRLGGEVNWDAHCVPHQTLARWVAIRAWVPEAELLDLVADDLVVDHADGTGLRLLPGAPVLDGQVWLDGQLIPVPKGAPTARDYGARETRLERAYSAEKIPWTTTVNLGGEPLALRQPAYDHNDALTISSATPRGNLSLITLTERCGELRFLAPPPEPPEQRSGLFGALGERGDPAAWHTLQPGTRAYWADGQPAGQVVEEHAVLASELYGTSLRCLEIGLGSAEGLRVPLCFDPADL